MRYYQNSRGGRRFNRGQPRRFNNNSRFGQNINRRDQFRDQDNYNDRRPNRAAQSEQRGNRSKHLTEEEKKKLLDQEMTEYFMDQVQIQKAKLDEDIRSYQSKGNKKQLTKEELDKQMLEGREEEVNHTEQHASPEKAAQSKSKSPEKPAKESSEENKVAQQESEKERKQSSTNFDL